METSWYERATSFERALFDKQLVVFPPNVSFRGDVCRLDGNELSDTDLDILKWIVAQVTSATKEIALPDLDRFKTNSPIISPKTIINFSGLPNAFARISGEGDLEFHLGILFTFESLPATFELINRMITGHSSFSPSDLQNFKPPDEVIYEIDSLMDAWDTSSNSGWTQVVLPTTAFSSHRGRSNMNRGMTYLIIGHELTHWFETIYKDAEWARMMTEMKDHLSTWLAEEKLLVRHQVMENVKRLLKDVAVLDSWVRELHADCGAFDYLYATKTHGGWDASRQKLMDTYVHMAFFFSLLTVFEIYAQTTGQKVDVTTHPPAIVRRAVFCHIQAKRNRMSQEDFLFRQFGAGTVVGYIMEAIIREYMKLRNS